MKSSQFKYTKDKLKEMRANRKLKVPDRSPISTQDFQLLLGELKGAGKMKFKNGYVEDVSKSLTSQKHRVLRFLHEPTTSTGSRPHLSGFLESINGDNKQPFRINGWVNLDGTIRFEIVK
jgi:hypothetical protein